ncbi:MAG: hypothetical protein Q4F95_12570 [Oscillospiraceae bacterium]|nr:hypothetical protein [Oscillospiraceae bacterium]
MVDNDIILGVSEEIQKLCRPTAIILISNKINTSEELVSFKLLVIVDDSCASTSELECAMYMKIDSDVPFDLVLYKQSEWDCLKNEIGTFAWKINNSGVYIYGQRL